MAREIGRRHRGGSSRGVAVRRADLPAIAGYGPAGMSACQVLLNGGEGHVPAGLLVPVAPVFSALLAAAFLGERLTAAKLLGSALIATGGGLGCSGAATHR